MRKRGSFRRSSCVCRPGGTSAENSARIDAALQRRRELARALTVVGMMNLSIRDRRDTVTCSRITEAARTVRADQKIRGIPREDRREDEDREETIGVQYDG